MSTDADLGPNEHRGGLPSSKEIAREIARIGRQNGIESTTVVVFGSYANDDATPSSDADAVVVSPDFEEDDMYARRYYWDWEWNHDDYPTLDLIPLRPDEFRKFSSRSNHIVATAVETGDVFSLAENTTPRRRSSHV